MGDLKIRELERRFKETGALADEAPWLAERLRVGTLSRDRLALAGFLGSAAAQLVLAPSAVESPAPSAPIQDVVDAVGFAALLRCERAVATIQVEWSAQSVMAHQIFKSCAATLSVLAPRSGIGVFCVYPEQFPTSDRPPLDDWLAGFFGSVVASPAGRATGDFIWSCAGRLETCKHPFATDDHEFARQTVETFGLGL